MRVPDLDWPVDLFKDVIILPDDTVVMLSPSAAPKPNLWTDMATSWMGNVVPFDRHPPIPLSGRGPIFL